MCGIFGTTKLYNNEVIKKKLSSMNFRGPDYQGYKTYLVKEGQPLIFGHVRLAILDLDERSNQPFSYNDNISVVFNGEIYNYESIKKQHLSDLSFKTSSDTEVLCAMYDRYGVDCVSYFNGMFSFVIYDKSKNLLFGARDRLGKKPFYYKHTSDSFEFSSQLTPILIGNGDKFTISSVSRQYFLLDGYIPDPLSVFEEVKKLRAGQFFTLSLDNFKMNIQTYWDIFSNTCNFTSPKSYEEAKETVKELLRDAVKIRLNADVPVGLFLSGGIDSSLVSAVTASINRDITAFTIGFDDEKLNESEYAAKVAESIGVNFVSNQCEGGDMLSVFNNITKYYDEPFADFSLIPTSMLAGKSRQSVTVALGGDGADEFFMGYYDAYKIWEQRESLYKRIPYNARKVLFNILKLHPYGYHYSYIQYKTIIEAYMAEGNYGHFYGAEKYDALQIAKRNPDIRYLNSDRGIMAFSDNDIKHYMNSCINTKTDRATMRSSLELRSPLMDYRLAEYSRLLPVEYMVSEERGGKRILKDILYEMIPKEILERPKMGFSPPVRKWFRNELRQYLIDNINEKNIEEIIPDLNAKKIVKLRDKFLQNKRISGLTFFKIYMYQEWYKNIYKAIA